MTQTSRSWKATEAGLCFLGSSMFILREKTKQKIEELEYYKKKKRTKAVFSRDFLREK